MMNQIRIEFENVDMDLRERVEHGIMRNLPVRLEPSVSFQTDMLVHTSDMPHALAIDILHWITIVLAGTTARVVFVTPVFDEPTGRYIVSIKLEEK